MFPDSIQVSMFVLQHYCIYILNKTNHLLHTILTKNLTTAHPENKLVKFYETWWLTTIHATTRHWPWLWAQL